MSVFATLSWVDGFLAALIASAAFVIAVLNYRRITRLDTRVETRMQAVEAAQLVAPSRSDFEKLADGVNRLITNQAVLTERVTTMGGTAERIENFLYNRAAQPEQPHA